MGSVVILDSDFLRPLRPPLEGDAPLVVDADGVFVFSVAYDIDGTRHELPPADRSFWDRAKPIYETLAGWKQDTTACMILELEFPFSSPIPAVADRFHLALVNIELDALE